MENSFDGPKRETNEIIEKILELYASAGVLLSAKDLGHFAENEIARKILNLYAAGIPFFTKDGIRKLAESADSAPINERIAVRGVDDVEVRCFVRTRRRPTPGSAILEPILEYLTVWMLTTQKTEFFFRPREAFLPIRFALAETKYDAAPGGSKDAWWEKTQEVRRRWESSQHYQQVRGLLAWILLLVEIQNIVGFGCSSLVRRGEVNDAAVLQHSLLVMIRDLLLDCPEKKSERIECYTQDPAFTALDEELLPRMGFTVVGNGKGFLEVDDTSVVLSISPDIPVKEIIADIAKPAVLIWRKSTTWADVRSTDPEFPRVKEMLKQYEQHPLPRGEASFPDIEAGSPNIETSFPDVIVYVRRRSDG